MRRNPDKAREAMRRWRERHPDEHQAARDSYDASHPQAAAARRARYRMAHPELRKVIDERRRARLAGTEGKFTLREWVDLKRFYGDRCAYCGCRAVLQADHRVPLAGGGSNSIENIVPACGSCNRLRHLASAEQLIAKLRRRGRRVRPRLRASLCPKHQKSHGDDQEKRQER